MAGVSAAGVPGTRFLRAGVEEREPAAEILSAAKDLYSTVTDFAKFRGWSTSQPRRTAMLRRMAGVSAAGVPGTRFLRAGVEKREPAAEILSAAKDLYSTVTDLAKFRGWSTSQPRRTAM